MFKVQFKSTEPQNNLKNFQSPDELENFQSPDENFQSSENF